MSLARQTLFPTFGTVPGSKRAFSSALFQTLAAESNRWVRKRSVASMSRSPAVRVGVIQGERTLFISLHDRPALAILPGRPQGEVLYFGRRFTAFQRGYLTFCYDWLQYDEQTVIGVRFDIHDLGLDDLKAVLLPSPFASVGKNDVIELFFSEERQYDEELSHGQEVLLSRLARSPDGIFGLQFDATDLADETRLLTAQADSDRT